MHRKHEAVREKFSYMYITYFVAISRYHMVNLFFEGEVGLKGAAAEGSAKEH